VFSIYFHCTENSNLESMEQNPWKAYSRSADEKLPTFYGVRSFGVVFTRPRHWSLSWASLIQSTSSQHVPLRDRPPSHLKHRALP